MIRRRDRRSAVATYAAGLLLTVPVVTIAGCGASDESGADRAGGERVEQSESAEGSNAGQNSEPDGDGPGGAASEAKPEPEPATRSEPPKKFSSESFRVPSKSEGTLSDLEVGEADEGMETVTFDLGTADLPEYHVRYVDQVRANPGGEPIEVDGEAYLEVGFELTDPNQQGKLAIPPDTHPNQSLVQQTMLVRNVGGELRFAIGLSEKAEFRAREDGTALVVELRAN